MHDHGDSQADAEHNKAKSRNLLALLTALKTTMQRLFRKKWARVTAGILAALPFVVALGWWGWSNSSLSKLSVNVAAIEGTAEYRLDDDDPWERVQQGMSFGEGAQLRTRGESRAALNFEDGSAVRLNSDTSVVLTKLARRHIIVQNTNGDIYARIASSDKRTFQVRAGAVTYQSPGTAYRVFYTQAKQGTEAYHNQVDIHDAKPDDVISVRQGKYYFLVNAQNTDVEGKVDGLTQADLSGDEFLKWNSELDRLNFAHQLGVLFDLDPPELQIITPVNGTTTEASSIDIHGATEKEAKILINGAETANNNGRFAATVNLAEGTNSVTVKATDRAGNTIVRTLSVIRQMPLPAPVFALSGTASGKGIDFSWEISGIALGQEFKLVSGKKPDPVYLSKNTHAISIDSSARNYTWKIQDGQTYHFRICVYDGETCTNYSNDVTITVPSRQSSS